MKTLRKVFCKIAILKLAVVFTLLAGCYVVPETGRQSLVLIDEATEMRMGLQAYSQALTDQKIARNSKYSPAVQRVGSRIAAVANQPNYQWEFTLFDAPDTVNAWCLPGGKIGIYTGLFRVVKNEAQLAFVTGHEVGHAVAKHGAERMSHQLLLVVGAEVVAAAMEDKTKEEQENKENIERVRVAYGIGSALFVMLPFSRKHEYEADRIGLMYMADAGYDPREALILQESFIEYHKQKGGGTPEYLSTHPTDVKRLVEMKTLLPQAMQRYYRATGQMPPNADEAGISAGSTNDIPTATIRQGSKNNRSKKSFTGVKMEDEE